MKCFRPHLTVIKNRIKLSKSEREYLKEIEDMFSLLQKSYLKRDLSYLEKIHKMQKELFYIIGPKLIKKNPAAHYLLYLARLVYLANSPLTGCLQLNLHK